ncbi:MAG TPA: hypothetical protein VLG14_11860 [Sphingomonas sp.]|jgi:hypothetical protein|nr:hypothetical protein [Sphingomonas sp.]
MSVKALLGIVPVIWFAGLAIYLYRVNQAMGQAVQQQLMPTIIGLGAVSLLLSIPLIIKLVRLASGTAAKPKAKAPSGANDSVQGDFDPDAVIARYLKKKAAGEASFEVPDHAAPRPTFGRKA